MAGQKAVDAFISTTNGACQRTSQGKVEFPISGMQFPGDVDVDLLKRYMAGSSYRRACVRSRNEGYNFEQHEPHIVPHRDSDNFLWCTLTSSVLPRDASKLELHVSGRRFRARLAEIEKRDAERRRILEKRKRKKEAAKEEDDVEMTANGDEKAAVAKEDDAKMTIDDVDDPLNAALDGGGTLADALMDSDSEDDGDGGDSDGIQFVSARVHAWGMGNGRRRKENRLVKEEEQKVASTVLGTKRKAQSKAPRKRRPNVVRLAADVNGRPAMVSE